METAAETLKAARALISSPEQWTQGVYARDANGRQTGAGDPEAVCMCSIAAIAVASKSNLANPIPFAVKDALRSAGIPSSFYLVQFNDTHTHAEVLDLFDRAIAIAEDRP